MAKSKKRIKKTARKHAGSIISYESPTFLLFLVFVLVVSVLLVARIFGIY